MPLVRRRLVASLVLAGLVVTVAAVVGLRAHHDRQSPFGEKVTSLTQVDGDWHALEVGADPEPAYGVAVGTYGDRWQFSASDGCNDHYGYLDLGPAGEVDARIPWEGSRPLMFCHGWHVTENVAAMTGARSIWLDGDIIRLVDGVGHVLGRYELDD